MSRLLFQGDQPLARKTAAVGTMSENNSGPMASGRGGAAPRPERLRVIGVRFDAVSFRIGERDRFAHEAMWGAVQRRAGGNDSVYDPARRRPVKGMQNSSVHRPALLRHVGLFPHHSSNAGPARGSPIPRRSTVNYCCLTSSVVIVIVTSLLTTRPPLSSVRSHFTP